MITLQEAEIFHKQNKKIDKFEELINEIFEIFTIFREEEKKQLFTTLKYHYGILENIENKKINIINEIMTRKIANKIGEYIK